MNDTVFYYGNWVWVIMSGESDCGTEQVEGFIIANSRKDAQAILSKHLKETYDIGYQFDEDDGLFRALAHDGVVLWQYVEPCNCINPESRGT